MSQSFLEMAKDLVMAQAGWEGVPEQVWDSTGTILSSQRDHIKTEGDRAKVETMGESADISQGAREGAGESAENDEGTEEKDGEEESVGKQQELTHGHERLFSWLDGDSF